MPTNLIYENFNKTYWLFNFCNCFLSMTMMGCDRNNNENPESIYNDFITENVIIVVIDDIL